MDDDTPTLIADRQTLIPSLIVRAGPRASERFVEFFTATIRNTNTRRAYARACGHFFKWCEHRGVCDFAWITSVVVAAYIEDIQVSHSTPTVKQHLAAIRMLLDWLVTGGVLPVNPAWSVRGPSHIVSRGKTPVLSAEQTRELLEAIDVETLVGLRDRAVIGVMAYTFARVGAVVRMSVDDYFQQGKRWWLRLHEKGGKEHQLPAHHTLEQYLDEYIQAAGIVAELKSPLFRTLDRRGRPSHRAINANDVLRMVKRRASACGLPHTTCCHTFRATSITTYLENGGTLERAQQIAAHSSPRTTKLYDRTSDTVTLDEIERIRY
ncbi:MAG: tyrosine-type recombinase/integrase [Phycisphaerales bacterium]|nr:tyrosine-type recombinase/integrase [Phycisphaerales bacterium]